MSHISQAQKAILDKFPAFPAAGSYSMRVDAQGDVSWVGAGGYRQLVFEWNGLNTSQFDASPLFNDGTTDGLTSPTLSVVADADVVGGNKLRLTATGTPAGYDAVHWAIQSSELALSDPFHYEVELDLVGPAPEWGGLFWGTGVDSAHYGYGWQFLDLQGSRHRVDAGEIRLDGTLGWWRSSQGGLWGDEANNARALLNLRGDVPGSAPVRFGANARVASAHNSELGAYLYESDGNGNWTDGGTGLANPPAGWNGLAIDRLGLSIASISSSGTGNLDLAGLRVFKLGS